MISPKLIQPLNQAITEDIAQRDKSGHGYAQMCGLMQSKLETVMSDSQAEEFIAELKAKASA